MSVIVYFMLENYCSDNCDAVINWFIDEANSNYSDEIKNLKITLVKKEKYYVNTFKLSFKLNLNNVPLNKETAYIITEGILNPSDLSGYPDERSSLPVAYMVEGSFVFLRVVPDKPTTHNSPVSHNSQIHNSPIHISPIHNSPKRTKRCPNGERKNKNRVCVQYIPKPRTRCRNGQRKNKNRVCVDYPKK